MRTESGRVEGSRHRLTRATFVVGTAVSTAGLVTLGAFGVQVVALALGRAQALTMSLLAIGLGALAVGATVALLTALTLPGHAPSHRVVSRTGMATSALLAVGAWLPDALSPGDLGRLQWSLILAGLAGVAGSPAVSSRLWSASGETASARDGEQEPGTHPGLEHRRRLHPTFDIGRHSFVLLTVFSTFLARYFLADKNSYWLDELYSVERYGLQHGSVLEAISDLAATSVHPPLYQFVLYYWMQFFGDGETATRTLSNVYVTLAVVFVYMLALRLFGRLFAGAAALGLSLTYAVMYYGLEVRSYAQSLMLSALALLALIVWLEGFRSPQETRTWQLRLAPVVLFLANLGLLLTHYYNFFFWGAQAAFLGVFAVLVGSNGSRFRTVAKVVLFYSAQLAIFLLVWGRALVSFSDLTEGFATESLSQTPLEMLRQVTNQSFSFGPIAATPVLILVAFLLTWMLAAHWPRRADRDVRSRIDALVCLAAVTLGAPMLGHVAFFIVQAERFRPRYMLYLVPGVIVLLATAAMFLGLRLAVLLARMFGQRTHAHRHRWSVVYVLALVALLVVPGSLVAARQPKADWRGSAQTMVTIIESNQEFSYVIYEPSFRSTPMYNYYLSRFSDNIRVSGTIRRLEERRGSDYAFERNADSIEQHDFLVIPFIHHPTTAFPIALEKLRSTYEVHHWQIDRNHRGIVIFSVSDRIEQ